MIRIRFTHSRQYYWVLQDDEMPFYSRPASPSTAGFFPPMVFRLEEHHYEKMDEALQRFWFGLNRSGDFYADHRAWQGYTETSCFITNGRGILDDDVGAQIGRDYIGGTGGRLPDPAMATLVCGRNVLCGTEMVLPFRAGALLPGTPVLKVETIDSRQPYPNVTHETHPHLVHIANLITNKTAPNGLRQVNAFPHRGGRDGYPVYFPLISSTPVYYPLRQLRKLPLGAVLESAYNPA